MRVTGKLINVDNILILQRILNVFNTTRMRVIGMSINAGNIFIFQWILNNHTTIGRSVVSHKLDKYNWTGVQTVARHIENN